LRARINKWYYVRRKDRALVEQLNTVVDPATIRTKSALDRGAFRDFLLQQLPSPQQRAQKAELLYKGAVLPDC
jgi:hypothetical protein